MKYREKLGYIVLGGVLMLVGMLAAGLFSPLGTQSRSKGNFDMITCRMLRVEGSNGIGRVVLAAFEDNAGCISVHDKDGGVMAMMGSTEEGGEISVYKDREVMATVSTDEEGGIVHVSGKNKKAEARMDMTEKGGRVRVIGNNGKSTAGMVLTKLGGSIIVAGEDEDTGAKAVMGIKEHGGGVAVVGKDGEGSALMSIDENGGYVGVFGKGSDTTRAKMGVNEYGNGAVSTWDKNGYRQ